MYHDPPAVGKMHAKLHMNSCTCLSEMIAKYMLYKNIFQSYFFPEGRYTQRDKLPSMLTREE